jgi:hypothetical protein
VCGELIQAECTIVIESCGIVADAVEGCGILALRFGHFSTFCLVAQRGQTGERKRYDDNGDGKHG